jgi:hypothetical protein
VVELGFTLHYLGAELDMERSSARRLVEVVWKGPTCVDGLRRHDTHYRTAESTQNRLPAS